MKNIVLLALILMTFSCQKEELTVVQNQEDTSFVADTQLMGLIKSVASHDGTFDDLVDQSSCFSINFPYDIFLNGKQMSISSINDLLIIKPYDEVVPVFPITITTANYIDFDIENQTVFNDYAFSCANGLMYDDRITCLDFNYPVTVSLYDRDETSFETITYNHDKETFEGMDLFEEGVIATINFPVTVKMLDGTNAVIQSNAELKSRILQMLNICPQ